MNHCTKLDEILHKQVPRQLQVPTKFYGHRSRVKAIGLDFPIIHPLQDRIVMLLAGARQGYVGQ